ncbi:MAG TPA: branched-chain amino acid ABC transporter substrate-binding protein [Candidatus Dormibacteraeota bacterium]|nr:branched-chain amino acid ABC transporter substrate-binding protein [Candidatus Dormibacteraeota bacterium]
MSSARLGLIVLLVLLGPACNNSVQAPQPQIVIASDFPFTAEEGPSMHDAIQLAVAQNSTVRGYRIAYEPFDDSLGRAAWPEKGLQNLKSMFADPRVLGMVGPFNSYMAQEEIPRASGEGLVMVSPSATNPCLTEPPLCDADIASAHESGTNSFFRVAPRDPLQGRAMASFAVQLGVKRVAAVNIWTAPPFGRGEPYVAEFASELSAHGGEIVVPLREAPRSTHDYTDFLAQAKLAGAAAIYAVGDGDGGICDIRKQMGTDFKYLFFTDGVTGDDSCLKDAGSTPTIFGTYGGVDARLSSDPAARATVAAFRAAYPHTPITQYTFAAYDCARILIEAMGRAIDAKGGGVPTRLEVLRQITGAEFPAGATGTYSFLPSGDARSPMMSIWGVKDNHWYYIDRIDLNSSS